MGGRTQNKGKQCCLCDYSIFLLCSCNYMLYFQWKNESIYNNVHVKSLQAHPTLYDHMDCSPPCSSVRGISQAGLLEQVAISFSTVEDLPNPGIKPVSPVAPALAGRFFTTEPPGKPNLLIFVLLTSYSCKRRFPNNFLI